MKNTEIFPTFAVMDKISLDKDAISQPELWRMALLVSDKSLDVALYPPVVREQMLWRHFGLDDKDASHMRGLEDAIYDNPLLLSDFKSVSCILNYPTQVFPRDMDPDQVREIYVQCAAPEISVDDVQLYECGADNAVIAMGVDQDTKAFLSRTYYNARFYCRMAEMVRYLIGLCRHSEGISVMIPLGHDELTIVITDGAKLLMANTFAYKQDVDAAYYILASLQCLNLDLQQVKVSVGSIGHDTSSIMQILQRYVTNVGPMPFPSLRFRATKELMKAPLDLLIRPICE